MSGREAGRYAHYIRFERQAIGTDDGYGNVLEAWAEQYACAASFRPQFGRERLEAGRLESTSLAVMFVRRCAAALAITAADRVVVTAGPLKDKVYQIRSAVPTADGFDVEFTLEEGVAHG